MSRNRSRLFNSVMLLAAFLMLASADKGYYGNSGSMNDAGDMEVHISMQSQKSGHPRCEEINIPMCRGIGYNTTKFPNQLNHETQEEAGLEVHQFWPLVEIKCSPDLKFFLCSMYTPICIEDYMQPLPVCRSVCERAREGCEPIMEQYNFKWPETMNCDSLPVHGDKDVLCMEIPSYQNNDQSSSSSSDTGSNNVNNNNNNKKKHQGSSSTTQKKCPKGDKKCQQALEQRNKDCQCKCRSPLVPLGKESMWYNTSTAKVGSVSNCGIPCKGAFFTQDEKDFASFWITLWSGFCAASTFMTLTTFLIDPERFKYPERPIVFLSACYFMVSLGFLTRYFVGHEKIACDGRAIKYSSTGQSSCTIVFLLIYYFGMASSIWWVILSFTWFLSAGLKWGNEAISKISHFFHLAAWLIPTLQSISVLVHPAVDGDPLAGICYVGNTSIEHLRNFVLAPYFVYLVIGTTFLLAGFVSLFRIRSVIKQQGGIGAGSKADKLEKLMIRIGIFSVLYTVPATIVIACHLYESNFFDDWMTTLVCPCVQQTDEWRRQPIYAILMLKYFMTLVCGITSGIWIWSGKTLESWCKLWRRLCGSKPDHSGAGQVLIKPRPQLPQPYVATTVQGSAASASLLTAPYAQTMGSMASSHHHLHHHVLKHPMSHV
ncbi:hypothetical protein PVAND_012547 [Polypedilum vanderplanki]|uniref:Frizzled-2 n=1 Tax=Polypedilum vanderplanki TaxID=319348 RepID=A0A9J6CN20_POLVA|nr:hypothetical protein PVAND_012547 [Polypedilum vanderplanki]